jgi:hypothetical protein
MPKFDLAKTQEVQDLFDVDREQRDAAWIAQFYAAIVDASMATTSDQVIKGPDGFPYFVLNLPPAGQPFEPFCISHILDVCLENGFGVVVQPEPTPPQWVFPYGLLWSLKAFGSLEVATPAGGSSEEEPPQSGVPSGRPVSFDKVLVGQPGESFFPVYARKAIKQFLTAKTGNPSPGVMLLTDPHSRPAQSLVFSVFPEDFSHREDFSDTMYRLTWFIPRHYGLISTGKDSDMASQLEPL